MSLLLLFNAEAASASVSLTPGTGELAFTGFVPSVVAGSTTQSAGVIVRRLPRAAKKKRWMVFEGYAPSVIAVHAIPLEPETAPAPIVPIAPAIVVATSTAAPVAPMVQTSEQDAEPLVQPPTVAPRPVVRAAKETISADPPVAATPAPVITPLGRAVLVEIGAAEIAFQGHAPTVQARRIARPILKPAPLPARATRPRVPAPAADVRVPQPDDDLELLAVAYLLLR